MLQSFGHFTIDHIFREANREGDWIANVGHLVSDFMYIQHNSSQELCKILQEDSLGVYLERRAS